MRNRWYSREKLIDLSQARDWLRHIIDINPNSALPFSMKIYYLPCDIDLSGAVYIITDC